MAAPESTATEQAPASPDRSSTESQTDFESTYDFPAEAEKPKADPKAADTGEPKPAAEKKAEPRSAPSNDGAEKKAEPEKPKHNPDLVELALDLGASQKWIDSISPAELKAAVRYEMQNRGKKESEPEKKDEPKVKPEAIEFEFDGKKHTIDTSEWEDQNTALLVRALHAQNKALAEKFDAQEKAAKKAEATAVFEAIEDALESLDPGVFGKGRYADLDQKSVEFQRRDMLVRNAGIQPGDTPKQIKAKLAAKAALFGASPAPPPAAADKPAPKADRELPDRDPDTGRFVPDAAAQKEMKRWDDGALPHPTPSREPGPGRALTPEERSDAAVASAMKKLGLMPVNGRR